MSVHRETIHGMRRYVGVAVHEASRSAGRAPCPERKGTSDKDVEHEVVLGVEHHCRSNIGAVVSSNRTTILNVHSLNGHPRTDPCHP